MTREQARAVLVAGPISWEESSEGGDSPMTIGAQSHRTSKEPGLVALAGAFTAGELEALAVLARNA